MGPEEGQHGERSSSDMAAAEQAPPHVLIFPFPIQGHITPMLKLAELLSLAAIRVTFLNTHHNHRRLIRSEGVRARLARRPGLYLRSIPDGLPEDSPRDVSSLTEMNDALDATARPLFRELLASGGADPGGASAPVTCLVADEVIEFALDAAEELGVLGLVPYWILHGAPPQYNDLAPSPQCLGFGVELLGSCQCLMSACTCGGVLGLVPYWILHGAPPQYNDLAPSPQCLGFGVELLGPLTIQEGVPVIAFQTSSACSFWALQRVPELTAAGIIPFHDGCDMDERVARVPGTESFLRRRDLPSCCRTKDVDDHMMSLVRRMIQNASRYRGLVLNSTEAAEFSVLTHIRELVPSTYPIGPLHGLLQAVERSNGAVEDYGAASSNSTGIWQEERACMEWLGARTAASVVYASFGSLALLNREQLLELWYGLVNSGYHFLWVARPGLLGGGDDGVPGELVQATEERGFLVRWAPQQEVLAHPAVGCFLTHSGWNSTLESMWAGVPMVCWPNFADQQTNSRFVSEVWGVGVDVKDTCDRTAVEKAVREVMAGKGGSEMREASAVISEMMSECVRGGSSRRNLEKLIQDIRSMSLQGPK